ARPEQDVFAFAADNSGGNRATDGADAGALGGIAGFLLAGVRVGGLAACQRQRYCCRQDNGSAAEPLPSGTAPGFRLDGLWGAIY
ncbi:MAG: hypothetical protein ABF290_08345, partial [Thiogranum sp.]